MNVLWPVSKSYKSSLLTENHIFYQTLVVVLDMCYNLPMRKYMPWRRGGKVSQMPDIDIFLVAELFAKLSAEAQEALIALIKSLLSEQ